jgi:PilZ domain
VNDLGEGRYKRRHTRREMEVDVIVRTDGEVLPGRTHDISESGMSAILPVQLHEGDEVELQIRLPRATETTRAIVRHRNVFRHGFEFVQPLHGIFSNDPADLSPAIFPSK